MREIPNYDQVIAAIQIGGPAGYLTLPIDHSRRSTTAWPCT